MTSTKSARGGLVAGAFVVATGLALASLALEGVNEAGLRAAVRATARWSVLVFAVTFASSSLQSLFHADFTRWLLSRRRFLGLAFAVSHGVHGAAFVALALLYPASFWATTAKTTVIGGSVGYVWIALMAATSWDGAVRRLGRRAWNALHTSGMYLLFGIFVFSYAGRAATKPLYAAFFALLMATLLLRAAARLRKRKAQGSAMRSASPPSERRTSSSATTPKDGSPLAR